MAKLVTHKFVSAIPDGDDATIVRPSNWNDTHDVSGVAESGTNTDITSMTGITGGISSPNFVQFDTTAAESSAVGKLFWDDGDGVLSNGLKGGNVSLQIGTQEFARVFNDSGTTLTKGQAVYISGAQGNRVAVKLARADAEATSFGTIGLVAETMTNGAEGFIIVSGALYKLDTLGLVAGATVYLSPTTAGALTTTKPQAPQQLVVVGWVERVNATVGSIYVKVDNGYELDELHDVKIVSPTTGQTLVYDQPTGVWNNSNAPTISGGTINGTTIGATTPSSIVGTTITGQTGRLNGTGQNLFLQSQTFTNGVWSKGNTSITSTTIVAPDSTSTASEVTASGSSTPHELTTSQAPVTSGVTYTQSFYLKASTNNFAQLRFGGGIGGAFANFNLSTGALGTTGQGSSSFISSSITSVGNGWYRCTATTIVTATSAGAPCGVYLVTSASAASAETNTLTTSVYVWGSQFEVGSTANTYIPTTTTAVYGTPTLSFSGVSEIGLQSNGALYLQPAGTGAIQAQATTSTTAGGNVRGANATDFQKSRFLASQVASGSSSTIGGGLQSTASGYATTVAGGDTNTANQTYSFVGGGNSNTASGQSASVVCGASNSATGYFGFVGNGFTNSTTSNSAVTTQSGTMNATTAVTLSGSNANIKVGQYITGTSIASDTYVAAISGTSLTLSKNASGSSTSTLSFFTPHGVVVGGGNNQATGSYSFIGGGGDAGTAANRNVASGDWSFVGGGFKNTATAYSSFVGGGRQNVASQVGAVVCGGGTFGSGDSANTSSGASSFVGAGIGNNASGNYAGVPSGANNLSNGEASFVAGGYYGIARAISGNTVFSASTAPIASSLGVSQTALLVLGTQTTDATATALRSNSSAAGTTNQVILPNNSAYFFRGEVVSGVTGGGNTKGWTIEGVIKRGANAASTALVGTPTVTSSYADAGASTWTIAVTADTTNGGLRVTFTGQASTTIRTVCQIRTTEMTY